MQTVYTLSDPRNSRIMYVGATSVDFKTRLRGHISRARNKPSTKRDFWIRSLLELGMKPTIELLDKADWEIESYWIAQFKAWGFELTNMNTGGGGLRGYTFSEETRRKMSLAKAGIVWDDARRQLQSDQRKGKPFPPAAKAKMIELHQKAVVRLDMQGDVIDEYISIRICARALGLSEDGISKVLNGKQKTSGGYRFKAKHYD